MNATDREPSDDIDSPRGRGLFLRIYLTFVLTVLLFALTAAAAMWALAHRYGHAYEDRIAAEIDARSDDLAESMTDDDALGQVLRDLERDLDARVLIFPMRSLRKLGPPILARGSPRHPRRKAARDRSHPRATPPAPGSRDMRRLRRGQTVTQQRHLGPPLILVPVLDPRGGSLSGVIRVAPRTRAFKRVAVIGILLFLVALAGGVWPLARSLTTRLAALETSTRRFARGELSHRARLRDKLPGDEIDQLGRAFNDMAERIDGLMTGQRTLLTNVSHELRTPIARMRVLVEILGERLAAMPRDASDAGETSLARLETGLVEMGEDITEIDRLIADLLTSGRLELGKDGTLVTEEIDVSDLICAAAARLDVGTACAPGLKIIGDRLLLDRLLSNLLSNARRACPHGEISIHGARSRDTLLLEIEDEGPGVPAEHRATIFDPFARLDTARTRDQGGVGLGLYLCRQIARAHGGDIDVSDRRDGNPGARFVLEIPLATDAQTG